MLFNRHATDGINFYQTQNLAFLQCPSTFQLTHLMNMTEYLVDYLLFIKGLFQSVWAAITIYHRLGSFKEQTLLSELERQESELRMPVWLRALFQILRLLTVIERSKEVGNSLTLFYKAPIPFRGSTLKTQQLSKILHLIISSESQDFYPMNLGMVRPQHEDKARPTKIIQIFNQILANKGRVHVLVSNII